MTVFLHSTNEETSDLSVSAHTVLSPKEKKFSLNISRHFCELMLIFARHNKKSSQNKSGVKQELSNFKTPLGRGALCIICYCVTDRFAV